MASARRGQAVESEMFLLAQGGAPASLATARKGMRGLEAESEREFRDQYRNIKAQRAALKSANAPLFDFLESETRSKSTITALRKFDAELGRRGKLVAPSYPKERSRVFTSSIGLVRTPPLDYDWTWNATAGGPAVSVGANRNAANMSFNLWTNGNDASASGRAAVGIYFRPLTDNGILRLTSNPSFNYRWHTSCAFASAHSDGWIGLYVGRYNLSGGFDATVINQKVSLWSDDSWWSGSSGEGSNSGFPLFAEFPVDNAHWYAMWVWCGGRISGEGWGWFSGSGAGGSLSATVPSITWELF